MLIQMFLYPHFNFLYFMTLWVILHQVIKGDYNAFGYKRWILASSYKMWL
jgi:hypothetical protein